MTQNFHLPAGNHSSVKNHSHIPHGYLNSHPNHHPSSHSSVNAAIAQPISVLLVDDNPDFRQGLESLLEFYSTTGTLKFRIVGRAASVEQAIALATQQCPSLVLLDLELAQSDGIQFLQQSPQKQSRVLVLSGHDDDDWVYQAMRAGARGYVFKHKLSTQLLEAIQVILREEIYLSPEVATCFFRSFHAQLGRSLPQHNTTIHLTEREREVLHCVVQGASNEAISEQLNITVGTVKAYVSTILDKMEVRSRTQAALKALKTGLIEN
ncbi:MAG: response regulator transcription factor [Synechococcales bacterium]|nr:response regulator transcription factor [Synechococcales bacterium]